MSTKLTCDKYSSPTNSTILLILHKEDLTAQACAVKPWRRTLHKDLDAKTGADISTETGATISIKRGATISTKRRATKSTKRGAGDLNLELFCLYHLLLINCMQHQQDFQYHYLKLNKRFLPYLWKKHYQFKLKRNDTELCAYHSYLDKLNDIFSPDPHVTHIGHLKLFYHIIYIMFMMMREEEYM